MESVKYNELKSSIKEIESKLSELVFTISNEKESNLNETLGALECSENNQNHIETLKNFCNKLNTLMNTLTTWTKFLNETVATKTNVKHITKLLNMKPNMQITVKLRGAWEELVGVETQIIRLHRMSKTKHNELLNKKCVTDMNKIFTLFDEECCPALRELVLYFNSYSLKLINYHSYFRYKIGSSNTHTATSIVPTFGNCIAYINNNCKINMNIWMCLIDFVERDYMQLKYSIDILMKLIEKNKFNILDIKTTLLGW